jgi:hypothetical protein
MLGSWFVAADQMTAVSPQRPARAAKAEGGKSELRRAVRRVTPGRGNSKDSGTENTQLTSAATRASNGEKVR